MKDLIEGFGRVSTHAGMLKDNERVSKYASAIKKIVQPGDVVADIGAGSGVLSAIAAQCGAKKVFAVEAGAMAEFASRIIKDNSLEAIVKVIRIDARDVEFEEQPDVIVSETLGNCGFDEGIDGLLQTVARRCKQDVKIIPLSYRVVTSLLMDDDIHTMVDNLNDVEGVCFSTLIDHIANSPLVSRIKPGEVVSEPGFHTSTLLAHDGTQSQFDFEMIILGDCTVNAVGCWFDAILAPGIELCNGPGSKVTSWSNVKLPIHPPLKCCKGERVQMSLVPRSVINRSLWSWSVRNKREARNGDAILTTVGNFDDLPAQLGIRKQPKKATIKRSKRLEEWTTLMGGSANYDIEEMTQRLLAGHRDRFASTEDARQEVLEFLYRAGALG